MIYKGNDNYYLEATSTQRLANPTRGLIAGGSYARRLRHRRAPRQHLVVPDRDLRRRRRCACTSTAPRSRRPPTPARSHLHQPAADRRRQHLRPVLRRPDRRSPRLQRRAHRRPDPDRPGHPDQPAGPGHDAADAAGDADRERGLRRRGRPGLGRLERQRRRHRLPGRALPQGAGCTNRQIGATGGSTTATRTPASPPPPATATASAPPTPPATSAPTRTPPAPPRRPRRRVWWRRTGLTRGRGRRSPTRRGTATTARSRTRPGRRTGKYGKALQFNGTSALVTIPDAASLHLTTGMTLEAWVNPSTVNATGAT